jgi:hypothetical protein
MQITPHVRNKWDKLKTVLLGTTHLPEFFNPIKNAKIREPLKVIAEETLEDLENFERILKDFGCNVFRTPTEHKHIEEYQGSIPRNSMQPRDGQLVIDDKLIFTTHDNAGITNLLNDLVPRKNIMHHPAYINDYVNWKDNDRLWAPCITSVDDKLIVDTSDNDKNGEAYTNWFRKKFPNKKIIEVTAGGHTDACMATIKPGAIISLHDIQKYEETFPGWDVCYLPDQGSHHELRISWEEWKQDVNGKYWVEGQGDNHEFQNYVNKWLDEWVGYVWETVFDTNVLVLDEQHVCISQQTNESVNAFLKKHKMEGVYVPWRHRWFWDSGLHCITLDLEREY